MLDEPSLIGMEFGMVFENLVNDQKLGEELVNVSRNEEKGREFRCQTRHCYH